MKLAPYDLHGSVFRAFFSRKYYACEFLEHNLPPEVVNDVDFYSLLHREESYISPSLQGFFADVIYDGNLRDGTGLAIYMLLDYQIGPASACYLQLLRFMVQHWDRYHADREPFARMPAVVPVVMRLGNALWRDKSLREMFAKDTLFARYTPDFEFPVYTATYISDEVSKGSLVGNALLLLWKALQSEHPLQRAAKLFHQLWMEKEPNGPIPAIRLLLPYFLAVHKQSTCAELRAEMSRLPQGEAFMKDLAQEFSSEAYYKGLADGMARGMESGLSRGIEQGMTQGLEQGTEKSIREILFFLAKARYGPLPVELKAKINAIQDRTTIDRLITEILSIESLAAYQALVEKACQGGGLPDERTPD